MRLDKHDIFPLSVVLFFGILIPLGAWLALGTRQQIARDFFRLVTSFAIACLGLALFVGWFAIRSRKREKKILAERGEQAPADFVGFGGWLIPTRAVHKSPDGTQTETTTSVSFDDVADSVFTLPDAIKALLAKKGQG
jgi:hypothetical protein